ncbi:MAG: response regulator [Bacteroidales bacterium]
MNELTTILYVDDEPLNLKLFSINFRKSFNVLTALSGEEGLEKLKENSKVKVVISDMRMPGMNGLEFISQAKNEHPNIVFFILTGYDISTEISLALKEKLINRYFSKPFNIIEIEQSIRSALKLN